jgi:hypothetical protein
VNHNLSFRPMKLIFVFVILLAGISLGGCSTIRDSIGQNKKAPDEFAVLARAPLSMPPNFNLRVPKPGAERPQEPLARNGVKDVIFKNSAPNKEQGNSADLLDIRKLLGTESANPNIRQMINDETQNMVFEDKIFINKVLSWGKPAADGVVVDASAESKRLKDNAAQGKPVTAGDTPIIARKKMGLLDKLF